MIIEEYVNGGHKFSFDSETKLMKVDEHTEYSFIIDINGIKTLMNLFKFLNDNKLL